MFIPIIDAALKVLDRVLPDPEKKAAAQLEILKLNQLGEFKQIEADLAIATSQSEVNKEEAKGNWFQAGWRPAAGYVCVLGMAYQFIAQPLLAWASGIWAIPAPPTLDMGDLMVVLGGMLGLSGLRTTERLKRKA